MNIGVIGTGQIVISVLQATKAVKGMTWCAVYSRKQQTGETLAKQFHIPQVYTDLNCFLSDPAMDTVYIASPNSLHYEQAKAALEHGKHVIVEKPFTSTLNEAQKLQKIAKQKHLFLLEAITTRYLPNYHHIRQQLPCLGRLRLVQCCFSQYSSRYPALLCGETPNIFHPKFSGGALQDINLYNIQFVMGLFGAPITQTYYPNKHTNGIDTSGNGCMYVNDKTNACSEVRMVLRDGSETCYREQKESRLYYEFCAMQDMIASQNYEECWKQLDVTMQVVACMEIMRKDAGIYFAADKSDG